MLKISVSPGHRACSIPEGEVAAVKSARNHLDNSGKYFYSEESFLDAKHPIHACVAHQIYQNAPVSSEKERTNSKVVLTGLHLTSIPSTIIKNRDHIETLIIDNNMLTENSFNMPKFRNLKELSVRNNKIRNIGVFIANMQKNCPNLEVLRVRNNPGWPEKLKEQEKVVVSKCLRKLRILDGSDTPRQKRCSGSSSSSANSSESE
ncbi:hypothetical protein GCK72_022188 [Caenorhabditis remanei]|uniref:Uncharacterized protein n=1 Tax=Caenorhabditis remanei TaxID=31234 RepID=A0A6A5FTM9_CAERE|nr:hypothetical protein GCK72_022188 [Caenorhabditis remanei]KAF1745741.1 hypothetical protein GCK72_022188 [Caenorhabditis remanei]